MIAKDVFNLSGLVPALQRGLQKWSVAAASAVPVDQKNLHQRH